MQKKLAFSAIIEAPIGQLGVITKANKLIRIEFLNSNNLALLTPQTTFTKEIGAQLQKYFTDPNFEFDLSIDLIGTPFQKKVWRALQKISPGDARSYGELARILNTSARAIGNACRHNPIPIIVPCHRIVASNGIGGFNGKWQEGVELNIKSWLLTHEGFSFN